MNNKFQYDKKQLPQVIALAVVSVCLFGYFAWRMIAPPPTAAAAPVPTKTAAALSSAAAQTQATTTASEVQIDAPGPGMRDPFLAPAGPAPAVVKVASGPPPPVLPPVMPSATSVQPLSPMTSTSVSAPQPPSPPAAPSWQVTGVVIDDASSADHVAILRDGDQRRYVRPGAIVDGGYRVESVDPNGVTLTLGSASFRLPLGSASTAAKPRIPAMNGADTGTTIIKDDQKTDSTKTGRTLSAAVSAATE